MTVKLQYTSCFDVLTVCMLLRILSWMRLILPHLTFHQPSGRVWLLFSLHRTWPKSC